MPAAHSRQAASVARGDFMSNRKQVEEFVNRRGREMYMVIAQSNDPGALFFREHACDIALEFLQLPML